jgi:hypothetical protein
LNRQPNLLAFPRIPKTIVAALIALLALGLGSAHGQSSTPQPPPTQSTEPQPPQPEPPTGKVLFSRDANSAPDTQPPDAKNSVAPGQKDALQVADAERDALTFTAYDLDVHLTPASAGMSVHAAITLRNDAATPLTRLALEITSSLHWDAFSASGLPLKFAARLLDSDADHTGQVQEAVVTLPKPLAPGATITLTALYSGTIPASAQRLQRIGAPSDQALASDWDAIATDGTALRGFGNVLWYPVAAPPLFLGDGAKLFQAVGRTKLRGSTATVSLRLAIEYTGDPPDTAFFCGRRQQLTAIRDNPDIPVAESPGVATAAFSPRPLGFRTLDLFVTSHPPSQTGTSANPDLISAVTDHYDALPTYASAATLVEPLLVDWLGPRPQTALNLLDHPGQPFEDDAILVRPMRVAEPATLARSLAHSLTHVWIHSSHAWIDEGLAQFIDLLWTERTQSRADALSELQDAARSLALAEPEAPTDLPGAASPSSSASSSQSSSSSDESSSPVPSVSPAGDSLVAATGELFYRTKAAAVWWMLRSIVGDEALKQALQSYRSDARLDADPESFQRTLEKSSHKDLNWFFNDWVYRDRGLPDLTIVNVTPSQLEARNGLPAGWLVAVDIRNDGYAAAEIPVTVRSGNATQTTRLRIAGRSSASTRIVFAGTPDEVQVNDGSVPETRTSVHTRQLVLPGH